MDEPRITTSKFEVQYEMAENPPAPMAWEEYEDRVASEWAERLATAQAEGDMQRFLEAHPSLVPGSRPLSGMIGHHGPFPDALITQSPLQGLGKRTPDFMWLSRDTAVLSPVLIEIEDPGKRWLRLDGGPHHELIQALDQFREWREWFNAPANRQVFLDHYQVPLMFRDRRFFPIYLLIHGRRSENPDGIGKLRAEFRREDQFLITFDHLRPLREASSFLCVRNSIGVYEAVSVPATVRIGPRNAEEFVLIDGKERAVEANGWISPERKAFLAERLPYWDEWARTGGGIRNPGDSE